MHIKMKKLLTISIISILAILMLSPMTFARKGVGIVWNTETEIVKEGSTHCVTYGIYNPWDEDVYAKLGVSKDLENIISNQQSEAKLIKAETFHENAVPIEFCFEIAKTYTNDCLLGPFLCEQVCQEQQVVHEGKIIAMEEASGGTGGTAGSSTSLGVSVPLKLKVQCESQNRSYTLVYVIMIGITLILISLLVYTKGKRKK